MLPGEVIDMTPSISHHCGYEIDAWLVECDIDCQYVIIEDLDRGNFKENQLPRLLVVNLFNGLNIEITERAILL